MVAKIKFEKKQNIEILLNRLRIISSIDDKFNVNYNLFEYEKLFWQFLVILDLGNTLSSDSKKKILNKTFEMIVKNQNFEKTYFINELNQQITKHNLRKIKSFYILTSISITNLPFRKLEVANSTIRIHGKSFPNKFLKYRNEGLKKSHFLSDNNYSKLSIHVSSKNHDDAFQKANYALEIFRSFLCLLLNSTIEIRKGNNSLDPINKVIQGNVTTIHEEDGNLAPNSTCWYFPDFKERKILILDKKKKQEIKKNIKWLIFNFQNCNPKHQEKLGLALNYYVNAFDEKNKFICFLKSWTVLEILTNTDNNDILMNRCISMFNEDVKAHHKQILECLRLFRNEYVHEGDKELNPLVACFYAQTFIYKLIIHFNLKYSGFFKNIQEANLFLDSHSSHLRELETKKKILDRVIKKKKFKMP
ncbi:hypothetical protein [Flexithrix dorotheae]|uniref:hypothetical protein n=1 Tax=Flexithrix dorotheae TaxID=70993 RepID=UPI00036D909F|nr:hypothetical protein [Flexithrix dorotheae]